MKRKILIASFLKQVNDIRSYEKIAKSLAKNQSYEIYCLGYPSNIELSEKNIQLLPLTSFKKNVFSRIMARWQVLKIYLKLKPELIIVNAPDLLLFTLLYKIIFGSKILYDIRENYFRNFWYQKNYRWGIKHTLSIIVRVKEVIAAPLFDHFFLAEKVYSEQLNFIGKRYTILENKSLTPKETNSKILNTTTPRFLISGTIAIEYGIFKGIDFFNSIAKICPNSRLMIIGHCPNKSLYEKLNLFAKTNPSIELNISSNPISHDEIEREILEAHIGLLPYLPNESTKGKWPTKLYEYMGYKLPFIIQENFIWNKFIFENNAGIPFDFVKQSQETNYSIWQSIKAKSFYKKDCPSEIYWSTQEDKLLRTISKCFSI